MAAKLLRTISSHQSMIATVLAHYQETNNYRADEVFAEDALRATSSQHNRVVFKPELVFDQFRENRTVDFGRGRHDDALLANRALDD